MPATGEEKAHSRAEMDAYVVYTVRVIKAKEIPSQSIAPMRVIATNGGLLDGDFSLASENDLDVVRGVC